MRSDGAIMVGVVGGTLDRIVLGWAAEEAVARHADLLVCHVREREPSPAAPTNWSRPDRPSSSVREAASTAHTWFSDLAVTTAVGDDRVVSALVRASVDARMLVVGASGDDGVAGRGSARWQSRSRRTHAARSR